MLHDKDYSLADILTSELNGYLTHLRGKSLRYFINDLGLEKEAWDFIKNDSNSKWVNFTKDIIKEIDNYFIDLDKINKLKEMNEFKYDEKHSKDDIICWIGIDPVNRPREYETHVGRITSIIELDDQIVYYNVLEGNEVTYIVCPYQVYTDPKDLTKDLNFLWEV